MMWVSGHRDISENYKADGLVIHRYWYRTEPEGIETNPGDSSHKQVPPSK